MGRKFYTPSKPSNQNLIPGAIPRGDSMVSVFGMGSEACGVSDMEYYSELLNHISEKWEVLARRKYTDYKLTFIIKIEKFKLSVYFRRRRTSNFCT